MTESRTAVIFRPIAGPEELPLFCRLPYLLNHELEDDLREGRRRPEWMWIALRNNHVIARVAWWGESRSGPSALDIFDVEERSVAPDRVEIGWQLLVTAMAKVLPPDSRPPEYLRFVPADWRDQTSVAKDVRDLTTVLERAGARPLVERFRFEWRGVSLSPAGDRLTYRSPRDTQELLDLLTRALEGTLDAHSQHDMTQMSAREAAAAHYEGEFAHYKSPHEWWRVATLRSEDVVGLVIPARNDYFAIIAYIAVLPEHRGHGYIDDILREGMGVLVETGVTHIRASTDLDNTPMAEAFLRAGWINFERSLAMVW